MTLSTDHRHLHHSRFTAGLAALALAVGLAGCTSAATTAGGAAAAAPTLPTPLATSLQTADGTWATIPMGRLDEPFNTFWQLLFKRDGTSRWSNQVEATATATNGGLVLTSFGERSLMVGVRPSVHLTFTPLISTSGSARSWSDGLITAGLAARPNALAADAAGQALALVDVGGGARVLSTTGDISKWRAVTTERALASEPPGQSCGLGSLTAVGFLAGQAVVGAAVPNRVLSGSSPNSPELGALWGQPCRCRSPEVGSRCWPWGGRGLVATVSWPSSGALRPTSSPLGLAPAGAGQSRNLSRSTTSKWCPSALPV